jgi:hypothetical protein
MTLPGITGLISLFIGSTKGPKISPPTSSRFGSRIEWTLPRQPGSRPSRRSTDLRSDGPVPHHVVTVGRFRHHDDRTGFTDATV